MNLFFSSPASHSAFQAFAWRVVSELMCPFDRGRLVKDAITKKPKLNCRNWECGVIIPLLTSEETRGTSETVSRPPNGLEVFDRKVPVPMQGPARPMYLSKPWFNDG